MNSLNELLEQIKSLTSRGRVVSCPRFPMMIPGIVAADAFDADDCFGTVATIDVPPSGILYSATFFDLDDEGTQVDLEVFKEPIAQVASDAAFAPSDAEILTLVTELNFTTFDDHGGARTSEITNIGKAYTSPNGKLYIQAVTRSISTIAAGNMPHFQLQILSDDPEWIER